MRGARVLTGLLMVGVIALTAVQFRFIGRRTST